MSHGWLQRERKVFWTASEWNFFGPQCFCDLEKNLWKWKKVVQMSDVLGKSDLKLAPGGGTMHWLKKLVSFRIFLPLQAKKVDILFLVLFKMGSLPSFDLLFQMWYVGTWANYLKMRVTDFLNNFFFKNQPGFLAQN